MTIDWVETREIAIVAQFLLVTDLDNTLVGDEAALVELNQRLTWHREQFGTKIVYSTGRSPTSYRQLCSEQTLLTPDALVTGVGTAIYYEDHSTSDASWADRLATQWDRDKVVAIAAHFADLVPQPDSEQGAFKVSFYLEEAIAADVIPQLETSLKVQDLNIKLIYSGGQDLDILPTQADKGLAMTFLREKWQLSPAQTVVCGDSGNDRALFSMGDERGIIVGNAMPELLQWHKSNPKPHHYLANARCAGGILEGLHHFGWF
ncbi:sucrose-phosphate phosphatase [Oscillatoria sp. FACHB-1407]|uniref:sucrose-phosphate phosphatase n=1 Tax=Oscillatoria sp. FACHB-1407 TaxID=2692847 RepID=UPI0018F003F7|nr:sucrose-phosphate phosphatase [Oscillatoria sp. FACHB-1407]